MSAAPMLARLDAAEPVNIWPAPDMSILTGGRSKPPALPTEMFGSIWPLIGDLAEGAGAPVDYVAMGILGVSASLIGGKRRVQPWDNSPQWADPSILWIAVVGDPSTRKSPAIDAATSPLRQMEADHAEAFACAELFARLAASSGEVRHVMTLGSILANRYDIIGNSGLDDGAAPPLTEYYLLMKIAADAGDADAARSLKAMADIAAVAPTVEAVWAEIVGQLPTEQDEPQDDRAADAPVAAEAATHGA